MFLKLITCTLEDKYMDRRIYPNRIGPQSFTMTAGKKYVQNFYPKRIFNIYIGID